MISSSQFESADHWRAVLCLAVLVLATSLPFVRRAYFVDDHYFLTMAKGLLEHPARPYDFRADDNGHQVLGWERGQPPRMVNPPLFHYYLAAVIRLWGDEAWKLRSSALLFSIVAVIAFYFLSLRFTTFPFYATCLFALTPAYWLTSYSLLLDSALIAWFLAALWCFMVALETKRVGLIVLSGVLMGAAMLTKYSGALIVGVALAWQLMHVTYRRWRPAYLAYVIFFLMIGLWSYWNIETYGATHLLASAARGVKGRESLMFYLYKGFAVASFLGGGTLFMLAMPFFLWKRSRFLALGMGCAGLVLVLMFSSRFGGFSFSQSVQLALWISVSFSFFALLFVRGRTVSLEQRFLMLWFLVGVGELVVVMPWTAGRYLLILLPPVVWLLEHELSMQGGFKWRASILAITAIGGFCVALSDYAQANVIFNLTARLERKDCSRGGCYYLGDTFSAYPEYLGPYGWQASFPDQAYRSGDVIVMARYRQSAWWHLPDTLVRNYVGTVAYPYALPLRVMDVPASAGWYASCWGALPFTLTTDPLERYDIYQVL